MIRGIWKRKNDRLASWIFFLSGGLSHTYIPADPEFTTWADISEIIKGGRVGGERNQMTKAMCYVESRRHPVRTALWLISQEGPVQCCTAGTWTHIPLLSRLTLYHLSHSGKAIRSDEREIDMRKSWRRVMRDRGRTQRRHNSEGRKWALTIHKMARKLNPGTSRADQVTRILAARIY